MGQSAGEAVKKSGRKEPPTFRRQFNESFCSPDGHFSVTKTVAIAAQIMVMFHAGRSFDALIDKPESLFIVLTVLIFPDLAKKFLVLKFGDGKSTSSK